MTVLGIDSSDDLISVGISSGDEILISRSTEGARKNILHSFMNKTILESGLSLRGIDSVAVSIGPGSFTGLRVGLAAAKGICWAANKPLAGVSSLKALAACVESDCEDFIVVKDARRGEFYYAGFSMLKGKLERKTPDSVGAADRIISLSEGAKMLGPGVAVLKKESTGLDYAVDIGYNRDILGGRVALLGAALIASGRTLDPGGSAPSYVRTPDFVRKGV